MLQLYCKFQRLADLCHFVKVLWTDTCVHTHKPTTVCLRGSTHRGIIKTLRTKLHELWPPLNTKLGFVYMLHGNIVGSYPVRVCAARLSVWFCPYVYLYVYMCICDQKNVCFVSCRWYIIAKACIMLALKIYMSPKMPSIASETSIERQI